MNFTVLVQLYREKESLPDLCYIYRLMRFSRSDESLAELMALFIISLFYKIHPRVNETEGEH